MPGGNGTGPWWAGGNWGCRRGFGRGMGRGYGSGYGAGAGMGLGRGRYLAAGYAPAGTDPQYPPSTPSREEEKADANACIAELEAGLTEAKRRLSELEGKK